MSYRSMWQELTGVVPKIPSDYCKTIVNRAWRDLRRKSLWSFQLFESNWTSPNLVNNGTVTVTQGADTVVFDATAAAAINAIGAQPSPVTRRQFRVGIGTIYNIWAWDGVVTATLDRPYAETSGAGSAYSIQQAYYPAPYEDFLFWVSIRDITNYNDLILNQNRPWVDLQDPQRTKYYIPTHAVYYQQDQNPDSNTYRFPMFELWGNPQYELTYQTYGIRRGADLSGTDELPPAVGEDCVMAKARALAYAWAEANKGDNPRNSGPDFRFLITQDNAEYERLYRDYRRQDRETVDNWYSVRRKNVNWPFLNGYYNSIAGTASPGAPWG